MELSSLTNEIKEIFLDHTHKKQDVKKDIFGEGYKAYTISIGDEAYDRPIKLAIGIPVKKIDPEMEKSEKPDTSLLAFKKELDKFNQMLPTLMKTYPAEFVAILNGEIVGHHTDELQLAKQIYKRYPAKFVLVREVKSEAPVTVALESPEGVPA